MLSFQQNIFKTQTSIPNFMVLNDLSSAGDPDVRFFNISNLSSSNNMTLEFSLLTDVTAGSTTPFVQLGNLPSSPPNELNFLGDTKVFTGVSVSNSTIFLITFGSGAVVGSTATVRCKVLSSDIDSIPSPNFIDITIPTSREITIENGICSNVEFPPNPITVYVNDANVQNGDIIYSDLTLNTPFNGGGTSYVYKNSTFQIPFRSFDIDSAGVVSNLTVCSTQVEVGLGDCNSVPTTWNTAYLEGSNASTINNGDVIYSDSNLTSVYNGNNNTHRIRLGGFNVLNEEFDISTVGIVSNNNICVAQGGIFLDGPEENTSCHTAQCFTVILGGATSKVVTITKSGLANYGIVDSCLSTVGQIISSDFSETITSNKTYKLSLDAETGTGTGLTTITISAVGGSDNDSLILSRNHSDIPQTC